MKILSFILIIVFGILNSQELNVYSFQSIPQKLEKPILIYLKTSWCSICKIQMYRIEKDSELKKLLNEKVYFMLFDTEKVNEKINFQGKTYNYIFNGNSGIHELAIVLSKNKKPIYPTWILINSDGKMLFYQEGLISSETLKSLIKKPSEN